MNGNCFDGPMLSAAVRLLKTHHHALVHTIGSPSPPFERTLPSFSSCLHSVSMLSSSCSTKYRQSSSSFVIASSIHCSLTAMSAYRGLLACRGVSEVLCNHTCNGLDMLYTLRFSFSGTSSDWEGKRGNTSQMATFDGKFTAGPWIDHCLPDGHTTIFTNCTRREINIHSIAFRPESSGGISQNCKPLLAVAWNLSPKIYHMSCIPMFYHHC